MHVLHTITTSRNGQCMSILQILLLLAEQTNASSIPMYLTIDDGASTSQLLLINKSEPTNFEHTNSRRVLVFIFLI